MILKQERKHILYQKKTEFYANLIGRKAIAFFIGLFGMLFLFAYGLIAKFSVGEIATLVASWTAGITTISTLWNIANFKEKKILFNNNSIEIVISREV